MLRKLRLQLTFLYLVSSIILSLFIGAGAYSMVRYYFQSTTDQALKIKIGISLINLGIPLPVYFDDAITQAGISSAGFPGSFIQPHDEASEDQFAEDDEERQLLEQQSNLADIYLLPLTIDGDLVTGFESSPNDMPINLEAIKAAKVNGFDLRTYTNQFGIPVRLLTYVINSDERIQVFQAGRFLSAQQEVLSQFLRTMVVAGGLVTVFFGILSWLLAGRTLKPSQVAWDKQLTFIANASHELRTPLTLIHAGVELGLRKATDNEQRRLLTDALSDADYMKKLIEDLLLLSRLDAHSLKIELETLSLDLLINNLTQQMSLLADPQSITFEKILTHVSVQADPVRIKQVLLIVLDNALRNSPVGATIEIRTETDNAEAFIHVTDHGQGINENDLEKVFDRFYKVDNRSSQEYRGSGLGLSIARGLIEAQKGHINLTSEQGKGTTVTLTLLLAP